MLIDSHSIFKTDAQGSAVLQLWQLSQLSLEVFCIFCRSNVSISIKFLFFHRYSTKSIPNLRFLRLDFSFLMCKSCIWNVILLVSKKPSPFTLKQIDGDRVCHILTHYECTSGNIRASKGAQQNLSKKFLFLLVGFYETIQLLTIC